MSKPTSKHIKVHKYYSAQYFKELAQDIGFETLVFGALLRSFYYTEKLDMEFYLFLLYNPPILIKKGAKMKKAGLIISSAILMIGLNGCAPILNQQPTLPSNTSEQVLNTQRGTILSIRNVVIKENGTVYTLGGATAGALLGSTIGKGSGRTVATLIGGLAGAYAGNKASETNAQEITIRLDSGRRIVVIHKGNNFYQNERVRIIYNGNKVANIEAI